jgi:NHL repeat
MSFSRSPRYALAFCAVAALLAGCSGGGATTPPAASQLPTSTRPLGIAAADAWAITTRRDRGQSWMAPGASHGDLLYVSDIGTDDVDVYSYPDGKPVGTLTGFDEPEGLCVDKKGDIWITNTDTFQIFEYAHGGTTPIATLSEPKELVVGCSVDQTTGNLAVSSLCYENYTNECLNSPGSVAIYQNASGTPMTFKDYPPILTMYFCGYDAAGDLFVDGLTSAFQFQLAELPKGSSTFTNITLNRVIYFPGGVQWDGKYMAVGDQEAGGDDFVSSVHQVQVSGSNGTVVSTTRLAGAEDVPQFWIQGSNVIGPNIEFSYHDSAAVFWAYPAGGKAKKTITGLAEPLGATVSLAK